jgi:preprotein translocase subunit SecD
MASQHKTGSNPFSSLSLPSRIGLLVGLLVICCVIIFPQYLNTGIDVVNKKTNIGLPLIPDKGFNLGLDLQGGAHLVYAAKTEGLASADKAASVEAVRDVIERRVRGGLGVAEPLVQTTQVGGDYRIIVELPGVTKVSDATDIIKKTPILEFKEANSEPPRALTKDEQKQLADFNKTAQKNANTALAAVNKGLSFVDAVTKYSQDEATKTSGGDLGFVSSTEPELIAWAQGHKKGDVSKDLVRSAEGFNIVKLLGDRQGQEVISASHLLICFKGSEHCDNSTLTREEALKKITDIRKEATLQNFGDLAKKFSTEPGAAAREGDLGSFPKGVMIKEFEDVVLAMATGTISQPVETPFGFHLIYKKQQGFEKEFQLARVLFKTKTEADIVPPAEAWKASGLSGKQLKRAEVVQDPRSGQVQVSLSFDEEGTKLFSDITTRNVGKVVAIFLDNEPISLPRVNEPINSGSAVISGTFTLAQAQSLARNLNLGALPVPVELISQQNVDATLGADSLAKSFRAGVYGLLAIILFMILYYRLPGLLSVFSLIFYAILTLAFFKVLGVTLTLSGIAGFILSIGMAVDANILVFERLKEELQLGKTLRSAAEESFARSWPSIRDGHITALISCVFLLWFGSGFVQGFAVILALGTVINLFTAITITRTIMRFAFSHLPEKGNALFLGYRKKS